MEAAPPADDDDEARRTAERSMRQVNEAGQTTMISPMARMMAASLRKTTPAQTADAKSFVDSQIDTPIVIFSKTTCPRCPQANDLLASLLTELATSQVAVQVIELDDFPTSELDLDMAAVQDYLWDITGCRTVPRIFVGGSCLGGFDDIKELHEGGRLAPVLAAAVGATAGAPVALSVCVHGAAPVTLKVQLSRNWTNEDVMSELGLPQPSRRVLISQCSTSTQVDVAIGQAAAAASAATAGQRYRYR
jgi:glutaredoxin 3